MAPIVWIGSAPVTHQQFGLHRTMTASSPATQPDIGRVAATIGDPTRIRMLLLLMEGRSLTAKEDQYTATRGVIITDLIATYKALGGGWEIRNRHDAIPQDIKDKMKQRTNWGKMLDTPEAPANSTPVAEK